MGLDKYSALALQGQRQQQAKPVKAFSAPGFSDDPEGPGYLGGFVASAVSSIPELFGANPTPTAEAFRAENPWAGFASEMVGFAVPYLGAERLAQTATMAPRVQSLTTNLLSRFGVDAATAPVRRGIARELIVNAPVEASRLAVAATVFPENFDNDLFADVALSTAITGGVGGVAGFITRGGAKRAKQAQIEGAEFALHPTFQLQAIENGAKVTGGKTADEYAAELEREVLRGNPGYGGLTGKSKPTPYVLPLAGHSNDEVAAINSLFKPSVPKRMFPADAAVPDADNPFTGMVTQYFDEAKSATNKSPSLLKIGESEELLGLLPPTINSTRELASNVVSPRVVSVLDDAGAREFAGIMSGPGWQKAGQMYFTQEKDGLFVFAYEMARGQGQRVGKNAGKTAPGARFLVGKTADPGLFAPELKQMADNVQAKWAKWSEPFQPRGDSILTRADEALMSSISAVDYEAIKKLSHGETVSYLANKLNTAKAKADGFLDTKFGGGEGGSGAIQMAAENLAAIIKPKTFLAYQNSKYGRMLALFENAAKTMDGVATGIMQGKRVIPKGVSPAAALRGKGVEYLSGFEGHRPMNQIAGDLSDDEANLIMHLSGTKALSPEGLTDMVQKGEIRQVVADAVNEFRAINDDYISKVIMPVFNSTGKEVQWLENHLGMPHMNRGEFFAEVKDEAGKVFHAAWGANAKEVQQEVKAVIEEAAARGKTLTGTDAQLQMSASSTAVQLERLQKEVANAMTGSPEDMDIVVSAMKRLVALRATGKNPVIPRNTSKLKARTGLATSYDLKRFTRADMLDAVDGHMRTLGRFAAAQHWEEVFGPTAQAWLKDADPVLFNDLQRKIRQTLGIEGEITNVLNKTLSGVLGGTGGSKVATKIAAATNETMHAWNLGILNPIHAILNLLTPLQTVAPWIAHMKGGAPDQLAKIMHIGPEYTGTKVSGIASFVAPFKILTEATKLLRTAPDDLRQFMAQATDDGIFHQGPVDEWIGSKSKAQLTLSDAYREGGLPAFLRKGSRYMSEESEKFSRLIAFNSAYILGKDMFQLEGDKLYRFMTRANEVTMYGYKTVDRSRLFTGPIGSMLGLFKNWQMHFIGNMLQYSGLAIKGQQFAPLMWQMGSATAIGGLGATALVKVADGLAKWHDDSDSSFEWLKQRWGEDSKLDDAIYYGLPAFGGISLQSSASLPGTDVMQDAKNLFGFAVWSRMKALGGSVAEGMAYDAATGNGMMGDPNVRDKFLGAVMPRAFARIMQVTEGEYVKSMHNGYPQVNEVSMTGRILTGAGFNATEVMQYQTMGNKLFKREEAEKKLVSSLGMGYADALLNGDAEQAERLLVRSMAAGVQERMLKSAQRRMSRETEGDILTRYKGGAEARSLLEE